MAGALDWLIGSAPHIGGGVVGAALVALANAAKNHTATSLQREQNAAAMLSRFDVLEKRLDDCEHRHSQQERAAKECEERYSVLSRQYAEISARLDAVIGATVPPPPPVAE